MGNRAVITTERQQIGIYMHWNGGRDFIEGLLEYCKRKGYPSPEIDCYGWARLSQVIGNFFGGSSSVGLDMCAYLDMDNGDNGAYVIKDWKIVKRLYKPSKEQQVYKLEDVIMAIDEKQPERLYK